MWQSGAGKEFLLRVDAIFYLVLFLELSVAFDELVGSGANSLATRKAGVHGLPLRQQCESP